jgi:iron complex transport system permease protein
MDRKVIRWIIWILGLGALLLTISAFSLCVGSVSIPLRKIISLLFSGEGTVEHSILFDIRLPRIILGFAIGGALSLAGVILQGMFRNPLVEPYTLGISGAAALGVSINIVLRLYKVIGLISLPIFGFLGALIVIALIYSLSLKKGVLRMQGLLLTGVMISFISSSLIMLIMAVSHTRDLHGIVFWIMGSLISIASLFICYFFSLDLNALSLGEEEARHLGVNVERIKKLLFIIASLLTAFSVSVAGIIGFVGLVVPHFVRMFTGNDHRILLIASFLSGASFLIFCDTLARTIITPMELPVGVITGILGGSLFVYALTKRKVILGEG